MKFTIIIFSRSTTLQVVRVSIYAFTFYSHIFYNLHGCYFFVFVPLENKYTPFLQCFCTYTKPILKEKWDKSTKHFLIRPQKSAEHPPPWKSYIHIKLNNWFWADLLPTFCCHSSHHKPAGVFKVTTCIFKIIASNRKSIENPTCILS